MGRGGKRRLGLIGPCNNDPAGTHMRRPATAVRYSGRKR